ncbi:MAG: hypothetical protein A3F12_00015 [Gammaproteobacteria bacterium RIFCSPHIGHO2_12_FULL_38_14]|nr:MAG: hypothetical protein A3F12_00015 [Gammaproteobacteria bacterium RIFCSPHIGHO2_12_FULL_38_14]
MENSTLAVITGASRGIGLALLDELSEKNIQVISTSRNTPFNESTLLNFPVHHQQLDVSDIASIKRFFEWFEKLNMPIHYFFNNAGTGVFKPIEEVLINEWESVISTNLTGAFFCLQHAFPFLKLAKGARVINMGSIAENFSFQDNSVYTVSKIGLQAISKAINTEWSKHNIFCTHIVLGAVATEIWKGRKDFSKNDMLKPDQVAKLIINTLTQENSSRIDTIEIFPKKGTL